MRQNLWIALDGGTTNTRATLVQDDQIIDTVAESAEMEWRSLSVFKQFATASRTGDR